MASGEGDCFAENPYMRPEYVSDNACPGDDNECSPKNSSDYKHRLLRRSRHRDQSGQQRCPSRSSSPFLKAPKIIKNDCDDSLYVKVEDLPDDVREQVRQLAAGCPDGNNNGGDGCGENTCDDATARLSRNASAFPFNEPRRLSAQPTVEEIQMCFAQVDLAILMEPKIGCGQPRPRACPSPCRRPSTSAALVSRSRGMSPCPDSGRRRDKCGNARASPRPDTAFDSDATGCDAPCQPPRPASAAAGYSNSGNRVRQLLAEFASTRRHAGGATHDSAEANYDMAAKRTMGKSLGDCESNSGARTNRDHSNELSYLRDDFARKLEQIHALAGLTREDVASQRNCGQDQPLGSPCGSISGGAGGGSRHHKRSLQVPVWTSTNNGGGGGGASRSRGRFRGNWGRNACEDNGDLSNDSDCPTADDC